ncbi:MAG: hypothetical protein HKN85_10505, partial [Gammaproteobacteria bacterium]|nr:hypothetical protein [Gammaproteobacteria bacterium]
NWRGIQRANKTTGDVLSALQTLEEFLSDPDKDAISLHGTVVARNGSTMRQQRQVGKARALAFFVHFIGDVHQPLHVGRRADFGGNKIEVKWFGEATNLHKVWDELLIASMELSFTELATFLNRVSSEDQQSWTSTGYLDWAKESKAIREQVYEFGNQKSAYYLNVKESPVLKWDYRHNALPIIKSRLSKGGIRLAAKLDQIFYNYPEDK